LEVGREDSTSRERSGLEVFPARPGVERYFHCTALVSEPPQDDATVTVDGAFPSPRFSSM
jgi:hypothetical protein